MATHNTTRDTLLVSGGDDGALAFVLVHAKPSPPDPKTETKTETETEADGSGISELALGASTTNPAVILARAHASAVTACAVLAPRDTRRDARRESRSEAQGSEIYVLTAGNDEWVRLWHVTVHAGSASHQDERDVVSVRRVGRCKTSVADVSSMGVLQADEEAARVLVCGVGMEVIRVEYGDEGREGDEMGVWEDA